MTTHHKDDCRCGSGQRYKHCHMAADQAKARREWMTAIGIVGALIVGVAAWGAITQWRAGRAAGGGAGDSLALPGTGRIPGGGGDVAGTSSPAPRGAFGTLVPGQNAPPPIAGSADLGTAAPNALLPGEKPVPWHYDVARNRHYDPRPGHGHWHDGPPPSDTSSTLSAPTVTVGGGASASAKVTSSLPQNMELAPGENPVAWEYDKAKNRHYNPNPGHRHWHSGPPPPPAERTP